MTVVRWGILSTADIARTQLIPAFKRAKNAQVLAISSESGKASETARNFDIPKSYDRYDELLKDPELDAIYIPLPNHLHQEWAIKAAEQGKHVLCEKPAALNTEEAKTIGIAVRKNGVKFMEGFMYQFHPQHQRVRDIIASGEIGEVKFMRATFSFYLEQTENIRMDKNKGGGSIYDIGCYCLHAIRNMLGSEIASVDVNSQLDLDTGVDFSAIGNVTLENGVRAVFDCSIEMAFRQEYEIVGTKGRIIVPRAFRPDLHGGEGLIIVQKENEERMERLLGDIYALEVEHFSQSIIDDREPLNTIENTINNMVAIDECYHSISNKNRS
ncbi:Gfo/Idh/MocA family oxidoreductase [Neobacillus sp. PS3-40]|uniref:Gfo/Idh/MocA family protein n=1 Tax=Neobacillus sp. PS3-40 TaxID=3070679 RepID=UPI0027DEF2B6|nr:Gfo/Idh/MocA family oxidoreductase [Neobacillus sp. PS3-40]WML43011.1 Gfo/Idh/MocA family oxidoreductase [Neobacillus sp. PS3-40]